MIYDNIKNAALYEKAYPLLAEAFDFIREYNRAPKPVGRYELQGDALYAMVQTYDSKASGAMEAHCRYIDLQYVCDGTEKIFVAPIGDLTVSEPYDTARDVAFYADGRRDAALTLEAGDFCVLFPEDGHKPGQAVSTPAPVVKIVVKIRVQ